MKIEIWGKRKVLIAECAYCGNRIERPAYARNLEAKRHFCDRSCNLKLMNQELNPTRMTLENRMRVRRGHLKIKKRGPDTYPKFLGTHEHRIVAERIIGRSLKPEEVVHHIDGDRQNNSPKNLMVFPNQAEHARWHMENDEIGLNKQGGGAI